MPSINQFEFPCLNATTRVFNSGFSESKRIIINDVAFEQSKYTLRLSRQHFSGSLRRINLPIYS